MTDQPSQTPITDLATFDHPTGLKIVRANDMKKLELALSAARRDAERYRWLREQRHADIAACWILPSKDYREVNSPEELDAAIDAAKGGK